MALVDTLHRHGIGVVFDWVGSHFPADAHALARFDGTALYEHEDPRRGFHPQWNSLIFNYGRFEVRDFLIGNVLFWLERYHFDAVRVDAVSSMLYLDFAREPGQWLPNEQGGHQNWEAVRFLQELNRAVYAAFPDVHMIAEESTAWEGVSRPVHHGGLGFGMKWNMGWMNDTLRYLQALYEDGRFPTQDDWQRLLGGGVPAPELKQLATWRLLALRRALPEVFRDGSYVPLAVQGTAEEHAVAFVRLHGARAVAVVSARLACGLAARGWQDTRLALPGGHPLLSRPQAWRDWLTGRALHAALDGLALQGLIPAEATSADGLPFAVLVCEDAAP